MTKKVKQLRRFKSLQLEPIYFKGTLPSVTYGITGAASVWVNCSEAKLGGL